MFDGVPEQLRRFITSPPPSDPPPQAPARTLPFPLSFTSFDPHHQFLNPILHHHQQSQLISPKIDDDADGDDDDGFDEGGNTGFVGAADHHLHRMDYDDEDDSGGHHPHHTWSSDEVLALLSIRSTMETLYPEFIWEHVSRKLAQFGFKRTPQECKEKFEEEGSRYFNDHNIITHNNKSNYRMFSELEELYHHHGHPHHDRHDNPQAVTVSSQDRENKNMTFEDPVGQENDKMGQDLEEDPKEEQDVGINPSEGNVGNVEKEGSSPQSKSIKKKRKRERFEMLKGFCESFVKHMIGRQEEMHKKFLEDMIERDEEKIAIEEAWKKQEMERINKELEIRAHEQATACDRNATIIKFISKFTAADEDQLLLVHKVQSPSTTTSSSSSMVLPQNPSTLTWHTNKETDIPTLSPMENPCPSPKSPTVSSQIPSSQNLNFLPIQDKSLGRISVSKPATRDEKDDLGKRWPRDEVLALINIRCSLNKTSLDHQDHSKECSGSSTKAPTLWERISQKMLELGYRRSARRCKEKWENINKYFRKTKDINKKRPLDSRTCPYFHQLSTLYRQGLLGLAKVGGSDNPETLPIENPVGSSRDGSEDYILINHG